MEIPGILVPPLTPFRSDLSVDFDALRREVDYVVEECHPSAVVAVGVETQEYLYLPFESRRELLRRTVEFVGGRCPVIVGVSHPSTRMSLELIRLAEDLGAVAIQALVPSRPFGGPPTVGELVGYFETLAAQTSLPIVAYHNPGPGADVPADGMIELARIPQVRYFKESSRDIRRVGRLVEEIDRAGLAHYFTTMEVLLITLLLGGSGGTMPPPMAKIGYQVVKAYVDGEWERAVEEQRKFSRYPGRWIRHGLAPTMKFAMNRIGVEVGEPYPPFQPVTEADGEQMGAVVDQLGLTRQPTTSAR